MSTQTGRHQVYAEGDTIVTIIRGEWTLSDLESAIPLAEQIASKYGYFFTITDVTRLTTVTPEARRRASEWARGHTLGGVAVVGASITAKAVLTLLLRLILLLRSDRFPTAFLSDEHEAKSWVAKERAARARRS